jgi:hypothetical protein
MLFFPRLGHGKKEKVTLLFNSIFIEDRTFTVEITPKEQRSYRLGSSHLLKSLQDAVTLISDSSLTLMDLCIALKELELENEERELLKPLIKEVIEAVNSSAHDFQMDVEDRIKCLKSKAK